MQAMKDQIKLAVVFDIFNMFPLMSYEGNEVPDQTVDAQTDLSITVRISYKWGVYADWASL